MRYTKIIAFTAICLFIAPQSHAQDLKIIQATVKKRVGNGGPMLKNPPPGTHYSHITYSVKLETSNRSVIPYAIRIHNILYPLSLSTADTCIMERDIETIKHTIFFSISIEATGNKPYTGIAFVSYRKKQERKKVTVKEFTELGTILFK